MRKSLLAIFYMLTIWQVSASRHILSGKITDLKNAPIAFASVYVDNSSYGTTANENGDYTLKLNPGSYHVVYRSTGYKTIVEVVTVNENDEQKNVQLTDEPFVLKKSAKIEKNKSDAAYGIMRQVLSKRKQYLYDVTSYWCVTYIKGVKQIVSVPKSILNKGMVKALGLDTAGPGLAYESESLSSFSFSKPDKVREVFIASKTAGTNPPFGYNKASDLQLNFYKDLFFVNGLSSHGFVSPAGPFAFKYYKFKLLGQVTDGDRVIDKIAVQSKIGKALAFTGSIYVIEGDWRLYSVDLMLTKTLNNLNFIDTLRIIQQYIPVGRTWQPLSFHYTYSGNVNGLRFKGYYLGINNNYKIDTLFDKNYFTGEILHVDTEANKKSEAYWANVRPMPLTAGESLKYKTEDSIIRLQQSKAYVDSVQHDANKFHLLNYLTGGYLATYKNNHDSVYVYPFVNTIYFNTIEGWGIYLKGSYTHKFNDNRSVSITPLIRYGTSDKLFNANIHAAYLYDPIHAGRLFFEGGSDVLDLNSLETHSLLYNTLATLVSEQNFIKYYRSEFIDAGYQRELANGILWNANISYTDRTQLYNTAFNHIFTFPYHRYTSNNPLAPPGAPADDHSELFPENRALTLNTSFKITFDQTYITRPTGKIYLPSQYPVIVVDYRKGITGVLHSDVNYDFISVEVYQDRVSMGIFGHSAFEIKGGGFLNRQSVYFMDYNHFLGNQGTTFDPTYVGSFHFLPLYTYSTDDPSFEAHYQHNFAGAILDNVPFLRKLKLEEIVGANYLTEKNNPNYAEFYFGLKRLTFGADYGVAYQGRKKYLQGFRIFYGLK